MSLRSWRIVSAAVPASESVASGWRMLRTGVLPAEGSPCVVTQMLHSHLRTGSARYCWEANRVPGSWRIVDNDPRGVCVRSCLCSVVGLTQTARYGGFCVPTVGTIGRGLASGHGWRSVDAKVAPPTLARLSCGFENQQRSENSVPQADHRVVHLALLIEAGDFQVQLA